MTDILGNKVRMNKLPPLSPLSEVDPYISPEVKNDSDGPGGKGSCSQESSKGKCSGATE